MIDRGSREADVREELEDICSIAKRKGQYGYANYCFLEVLPPYIEEGIKKCLENGADFITISTLQPLHNNGGVAAYQWMDRTRPAGRLFYRIKGVEKDGKHLYSAVMSINTDKGNKTFSLFPNPVSQKQFTWQANLAKGHYILQVTGSNGQQVLVKAFSFHGGNISEVIHLPGSVVPGVYTLQITNGNYRRMQSFIVL